MKQLIFCFLTSIFFFSACKKAILPPNDDIYVGKVTISKGWQLDSFSIKLKLSNGQFSYLTNGCKGNYEIKNDKITFSSNECACWCNCCILCDCAGDWILSTFDFISENGHLIFTRSYGNISLGGTSGTITFDLKKE
jgi:hypothetical protein